MNAQAWIHWLEQGRGAAALKGLALLLGVVALSLTVAYKQFHGPRTEETLRQADLGRSIATGEGFTTSVNYPQVYATMRAEQPERAPGRRLPEVYHPPGYPLVIATALKLLPAAQRDALFAEAPAPPDGFGADYLLLALNVLLFWVAVIQTWRLGTRLFDRKVGGMAAIALLVSMPAWTHVVAVDGAALTMVLLLGVFQCLARADLVADAASGRPSPWWLGAGALAGLLFLTDYPYGIVVLAVSGHALWRRRSLAAVLAVAVALAVATPWLLRNVAVTGSPLGLAGQDLALRAGDPTADPAVWRNTLSAETPAISLNKLGNKVLTALQSALRDGLWSGGGLVLTAFFVTGWIYRFRRESANRLRTLFAGVLGLLIVTHGLCNSGEGERVPTVVATPLIIVFGVGFFAVLAASSEFLRTWPRLAVLGLLGMQALPLAHDLAEPRRIHFSYPPYYPAFFLALGQEMELRGDPVAGWMCDVPAGAAWYASDRVWSRPATLRDFYSVDVDQHQVALVLTPATLDRPFFAELLDAEANVTRFGEWGKIYTGLISGELPRTFPLSESRALAPNFQLLVDPAWAGTTGK
ncbi:glycosyltransferase family 39 protein [Actomonas aquatica]|uniref:Glycosyltransferase family 39 protein n=1 Tax=Actomonas aquatica TaxID=2866162 RepID=A0ABZ1C786_9BACT|nr:glycosyltransferase family 39 protein [Opitutus sp. WL0086]WRQ87584.1 glycosyltransferase family 39 protein [Opitutus sp. WL0086]